MLSLCISVWIPCCLCPSQLTGKLPYKLPAIGATGDHELSSWFFLYWPTLILSPWFNSKGSIAKAQWQRPRIVPNGWLNILHHPITTDDCCPHICQLLRSPQEDHFSLQSTSFFVLTLRQFTSSCHNVAFQKKQINDSLWWHLKLQVWERCGKWCVVIWQKLRLPRRLQYFHHCS